MSAAHTLYASYASVVSTGDATVNDFRTLVESIKDSARCNCLPCKVVTTMCVTCNSDDEYILSMSKEMTDVDAWGMQTPVVMADHLCPFGADRRWEIDAAAEQNAAPEPPPQPNPELGPAPLLPEPVLEPPPQPNEPN